MAQSGMFRPPVNTKRMRNAGAGRSHSLTDSAMIPLGLLSIATGQRHGTGGGVRKPYYKAKARARQHHKAVRAQKKHMRV